MEEAVLEMAVDELKPQVSSVKGGKHVLNKKIKEQTKSLATEKERSKSPEGMYSDRGEIKISEKLPIFTIKDTIATVQCTFVDFWLN